ncbi:hypothetical protein SUDANB178_04361 [Streptomyces sp. enrichment culture]
MLTVKALGTTTTCTPVRTAVPLTLDTAEQRGGAAGGTSASGGSSGAAATGGGDGGLAGTGAGDHGALRALGLVAGTAVPLGTAVFPLMPRRGTR